MKASPLNDVSYIERVARTSRKRHKLFGWLMCDVTDRAKWKVHLDKGRTKTVTESRNTAKTNPFVLLLHKHIAIATELMKQRIVEETDGIVIHNYYHTC